MSVRIRQLESRCDERGEVYPSLADWCCPLREIRNLHVTTLLPGKVRGNHFHISSKELLIVKYSDAWQFHWEEANGTRSARSFEGRGVALIEIEPESAHAAINTGARELTIVSIMESRYDLRVPDAQRKVLLPEE